MMGPCHQPEPETRVQSIITSKLFLHRKLKRKIHQVVCWAGETILLYLDLYLDPYNIYPQHHSSPEQYNYQESVDNDFTTSTTTTVLILNPDGSLSNEFTVGEGINLEDIKQELYGGLTPPRSNNTLNPPKSSPIPLDLSSQSMSLPPLSSISSSSYSPLPSVSSLMQSSGNGININHPTINISQPNIILPNQQVISSFTFNSTQNQFTSTQNNFTLPVKNIYADSVSSAVNAITSPLPRHTVLSENNSLKFSQAPRNVIDSALGGYNLKTSPSRDVKSPDQIYRTSHPVYLHQKENLYLLEELGRLPTRSLSPESLSDPQTKVLSTLSPVVTTTTRTESNFKMRQKTIINRSKVSQNSAPYKKTNRTKSIGAIGQALHGLHGKQVCPLCKFEATTKNPYRHLQDHLGNNGCKTLKYLLTQKSNNLDVNFARH